MLALAFAPALSSDRILQEGEELNYEVSFLGIGLGSIKIITEKQTDIAGTETYKTKSIIKSYEGIPYNGIHAIYESWIDPTVTFSHQFVGNTKFMSDTWVYEKYIFDYTEDIINAERWARKRIIRSDTMATLKKWNDGLSLFFLARQYTDIQRSIKIPTIMNFDTSYTVINFQGKRDEVEIDAIEHPVKTIYFDGKAEWEGLYGLSGNFEGWFSDDDARVPIVAKMNIIIGSIRIELIEWKRRGWIPPKAI